jgi:hypothetical protein
MYALLTRAPLVLLLKPFDLHVLSLPLAFILSQDQTLHSNIFVVFRPCETARTTYFAIKV